MSVLKKIYKTVFPEAWCCALRFNDSEAVSILNDTVAPFHVLTDTKRYWTADPFLFKYGEKYYLFFEAFDRLHRKGLLGYREIGRDHCGEIKIIYESKTHLSYPFIYQNEDGIFIIPESNKSNELYRLKCISFPDKWEKEKTITEDKLADTTLFNYDGVDYYFSERVDDTNCFDRLDLFYDENGTFTECKNNPVKLDADTARCAGKVFKYENDLIRPSQNCGESYGEKLNFNRITKLSKDGYSEELIKTVSHSDVKLNRDNNYVGIHTYNRIDSIEVIDLKIKSRFNFMNFIGIFHKIIVRLLNRG